MFDLFKDQFNKKFTYLGRQVVKVIPEDQKTGYFYFHDHPFLYSTFYT